MTLRHLEIFLVVAQTGSMRKAAQQLYISQPTVSGVIRDMEQEYQVRLFERLNQRLYITPEGRKLTIYARELLSLFHEMEYTMRRSTDHAVLRIGATLTIGTCILPDILQKLDLPTSVVVENTHDIAQRLVCGELDIGFVEGKIQHTDLTVVPVVSDELIAVFHTPQPPMTLLQLCQNHKLLLRERGSGTRELFEEALTEKGISCQTSWICSNTQTLIRAAQSGLGVTVISKRLVADTLKEQSLFVIPLTDCNFERMFSLVWHKDKFQGESFRTFCQLCVSTLETN